MAVQESRRLNNFVREARIRGIKGGRNLDRTAAETFQINLNELNREINNMAFYPTIGANSNNTTVKTALQTESVISKTPLGSMPAGLSTITCAEYSTGKDVVTVLTLTNFVLGTIPAANAALGVGANIYSFPAGQHFELVYGLSAISLKLPSTGVACDTGLGSVVASGAVSVLSGTSTFEDRSTGVAITTSSTGGTAVSSLVGATAGIGTGISLNVAASVKDVFLNAAGTFGTGNAGSLTASGLVVLKWTIMN